MIKKTIISTFLVTTVIMILLMVSSNKVVTFRDVYEIDGSYKLNSISVISFSDIESVNNELTRSHNFKKITSPNSEFLYDYLLDVEIMKVKPVKTAMLESIIKYDINLSTKNGETYSSFAIGLGENYMLVTSMKDGGELMYKHDLTKDIYEELVEQIELYSK